jgi:hypothetical protein
LSARLLHDLRVDPAHQRPLEGPDRKATLKKRVVTIPPVQMTKLYEVDGRKVGYIVFRNFVEPSVAALDDSFNALRDAGATELVLDMRYNGGGLVSVAQHLASLIGGDRMTGKVLAEYVHNDRHRELNSKLLFQAKPNALNLTRLVVITTRASASASELIINGLRPYIPVTVVGDRTYGMPAFGFGYRAELDSVAIDVSFLNVQVGASDYYGSSNAGASSLLKLSGLYLLDRTANATPYVGGGLSWGNTSFSGNRVITGAYPNGYDTYTSGGHGSGLQRPANVHFTREGSEYLGKQVAASVENALTKTGPRSRKPG